MALNFKLLYFEDGRLDLDSTFRPWYEVVGKVIPRLMFGDSHALKDYVEFMLPSSSDRIRLASVIGTAAPRDAREYYFNFLGSCLDLGLNEEPLFSAARLQVAKGWLEMSLSSLKESKVPL